MKRYRVLTHDFDSRALLLNEMPGNDWTPQRHEEHQKRIVHITGHLAAQFGTWMIENKVENFRTLGAAPLSIIAFHNKFFRQTREAFTLGAYYPALTAACALGERILNHLILSLREHYRTTEEYRRVYRKDSFDDWGLAIGTLQSWGVLVPEAVTSFEQLAAIRNAAIHFRPETDTNDRPLALEAIRKLTDIISAQFSSFGLQPWYIEGTRGACFVRRAFEDVPFVAEIVLPNCRYVGYLHGLSLEGGEWAIYDTAEYEARDVTDEEFRELFNNRNPDDVVQPPRVGI